VKVQNLFEKKYFIGVPHLATCIFLFVYNEPELGVGIDPGMALTPFPSSIGQGSNPQPSDVISRKVNPFYHFPNTCTLS